MRPAKIPARGSTSSRSISTSPRTSHGASGGGGGATSSPGAGSGRSRYMDFTTTFALSLPSVASRSRSRRRTNAGWSTNTPLTFWRIAPSRKVSVAEETVEALALRFRLTSPDWVLESM